MQDWMIAATAPLVVWCGLFLYLRRIEGKVDAATKRLSDLK